ncbi:hypothetical protein IWQ51_005938 [Labrenzia sp. EL_142]|nr:hypothetical protein [Labrenzia sp. EL_142]
MTIRDLLPIKRLVPTLALMLLSGAPDIERPAFWQQ